MSEFLDKMMRSQRAKMAKVGAAERATMREQALAVRSGAVAHRFYAALAKEGQANIIAEVKRSSPSVGAIATGADVLETARRYELGGAAAISVLTESEYFGGSLQDLKVAAAHVGAPLLRKEFVVDEHQIYEAAACGASAILLIVAGLEAATLLRLRRVAEEELGMDALVETHTADELRAAIGSGARVLGVNNRNLQTLQVSLDNARAMATLLPRECVGVCESGLKTVGDVVEMRGLGYQAFLIGETLMRAADPAATLRAFAQAGRAR